MAHGECERQQNWIKGQTGECVLMSGKDYMNGQIGRLEASTYLGALSFTLCSVFCCFVFPYPRSHGLLLNYSFPPYSFF